MQELNGKNLRQNIFIFLPKNYKRLKCHSCSFGFALRQKYLGIGDAIMPIGTGLEKMSWSQPESVEVVPALVITKSLANSSELKE